MDADEKAAAVDADEKRERWKAPLTICVKFALRQK